MHSSFHSISVSYVSAIVSVMTTPLYTFLLLLILTSLQFCRSVDVVDLRKENLSQSNGYSSLAVFSCAGLLNRNGPSTLVYFDDYDEFWLSSHNSTSTIIDSNSFLASCFSRFPAILYDSTVVNNTMLPSVVTLCGVLDALPMDMNLQKQFPSTRILLNTVNLWSAAEQAVSYAMKYLNQTTSLAFQEGNRLAFGYLADFIIHRRLFALYLPKSCIPLTADHALLKSVVSLAPWSKPIRVYGYNAMNPVLGGDLFEAETDCINTMGQVATANTNNLSFWSQTDAINSPLSLPSIQNNLSYDSKKTYVSLVYGDMDNIDFVRSFGKDHMTERVKRCEDNPSSCFPFTWTLSPNLIDISPNMMRWYYDNAGKTGGKDQFIMPPSGTLYSYPGMMPSDVQQKTVEQQTRHAYLMNTTGTIHWEWFFAWKNAWNDYFPRYSKINATDVTTRAFFLNNVPWPVPIADMLLKGETFRFVGNDDNVVGFKPAFNWCCKCGGGESYSPAIIAAQIALLKRGSVQYVYIIQNTDLNDVYDMVARLPSNVEIVSYTDLIHFAKQKKQRGNSFEK